MKTRIFTVLTLAAMLVVGSVKTFAQETEEAESPFSLGADVVSTYVWRGVAYAGPAIQPYVEFGAGNFSVGAWGSYDYGMVYPEADLYLSYGFDFGLSLGVTDYFYPGSGDYFEYDDSTGTHAFEINAGYEIGGFSASANYILNESPGAGSEGGDMYFELGYGFKHFDVFVGAGNGWLTVNDDNGDDPFGVTNVGISTSKEIKITDSYSLPVFGAAIVNPQAGDFNIVVGVSF